MKVIFSEGSGHLDTMEMQTTPRVGENIVVHNRLWVVKRVTHLPKKDGRNDNENTCGWDSNRDADIAVRLEDDEV